MKNATFNSVHEFADACEKVTPELKKLYSQKEWTGETWDESMKLTRSGDTSLVAESEKLLNEIQAELTTNSYEWGADMAGAFPNVPAYLSNDPACMRRKMETPNDKTPVNIYMCGSSSASVSFKLLQKRGVAVLALVMKLQATRKVNLWIFDCGHSRLGWDYSIKVKVSNPDCISETCYVLTSQGFMRNMFYGLGRHMFQDNGSFARTSDAKMINPQPHDILLTRATYKDLIQFEKPVEWVNATMKQIEGVEA